MTKYTQRLTIQIRVFYQYSADFKTVGCCSHIAAVIYYLSHSRYLSRIINPAEVLNKLSDFEGAQPVIEEDSDDDD